MPYNVNEVLEFLKEPKTRKEVMEEFDLSNNESYHLMRWLTKGKFAQEYGRIPISGISNRVKLYIAKAT